MHYQYNSDFVLSGKLVKSRKPHNKESNQQTSDVQLSLFDGYSEIYTRLNWESYLRCSDN